MGKEIKNLEALKALDLNECKSVGDIVNAMKLCSFGARMLGEVADTILGWIGKDPIIIYDGDLHGPVGRELKYMVKKKWFRKIVQSNCYLNEEVQDDNVLVVGNIGAKGHTILADTSAHTIFINPYGFTKFGLIDGYYPNLVVCDPNIAIPIITAALFEKLDGKSVSDYELFVGLERFEGIAPSTVKGAETVKAMIEDKNCTVFLTISGAMTIAKMGLIITDMIDNGYVDCVTTTGALICHNLIEKSDYNESNSNE